MIAECPADPSVAIEPQYAAELALVAERMGTLAWRQIEELESVLERFPQEPLPLHHVFVPGVYLRECFLEKGKIVTTRIHLTKHPFILSAGVVSVRDGDGPWVTLRAPYTGITMPGTRRVIFVHESCIWSSIHANPTNETDPDAIVRRITFTDGKFSELGIAAKQSPEELAP